MLMAAGIILAAFSFSANAQTPNYVRNGKEFSVVKSQAEKVPDEKTGYTWKDSKGNVYDIFITKNNACYTIRTSQKTGKEYRAYLPKEVAAEIAKELGRKIDYGSGSDNRR